MKILFTILSNRGGSEHKLMPGQKKKNFFQANSYLSIGVVDTNNYYHSNNVTMIIIIYGKCFLRPAGHGQYCSPQTNDMESSKLRSSLRSTPAMSIKDTSKDYFIIVHNS